MEDRRNSLPFKTEDSIASRDLKLILLGDRESGKHDIINQLQSNANSEKLKSAALDVTLAMSTSHGTVRVHIHDTAGQERFRSITSSYYRGAHGCILLYDQNDLRSLLKVQNWFEDFQRQVYDPKATRVILVGVKKSETNSHPKDHSTQTVSEVKGQEFAYYLGVSHHLVDASSYDSVKSLFTDFGKEILSAHKERRDSFYATLSLVNLSINTNTKDTTKCSC